MQNKLKSFLENKNVNFEIIEFEDLVMTSEQAAKKVNGKILKSILVKVDDDFVLCILEGKDKIDFEKIKKLGYKEVRLAKAKEVREFTGYDIGSLPPIFEKEVLTLIDKKLENLNEIVYCGGGTHRSLLKINSQDLFNLIKNKVFVDIST